jgi:hypothetical protein
VQPIERAVELLGPDRLLQPEAAAETLDLGPEETLVADVRHDDLRDARVKRAGGGAGAAVVDDGRGVFEELVVRDFADDLDVFGIAELRELGPAALHDDAPVARPGADDAGRHGNIAAGRHGRRPEHPCIGHWRRSTR